MDERRLRYFLAVLEEGGVTRAAARLHVAQPSLSQALRAFERELGVALFDRVGRGLAPSSAGVALSGPARRILHAIDEARAALSGVVELRTGTLEVAALATLAVDPMAGLIGRFRERYPGVRVRVLEGDSVTGVGTLVREGACELGAATLPVSGTGLRAHRLRGQELLFILPPRAEPGEGSSARAGARPPQPIRAAELAATPLVVSPPGTSTRNLLEQTLSAVGVAPRIAVETASREAIVPLVLAGAGAALLPAPLAREAERRGAVLRSARPPIRRRVGLIHRPGPLSAAARAFLAMAGED
jgi:LysR family transcriptional regulator, carnitine catabolism transcriptional activator